MFALNKRSIRVAVSSTCNFKCVYCDYNETICRSDPNRPGAMEDFRSKPLSEGNINTNVYLEIIRALHLAGFEGITLTGGEPTLNPEWDVIVNKSKEMGMKKVGLTTNGALLNSYIKKNKGLPKISLLTISINTDDPERFKRVTGRDVLPELLLGLKVAKEVNPRLTIRANKVIMQSDLEGLPNFLKFCEETGFIDEVNLLNLILKDRRTIEFFKKEYISAQELMSFLSAREGYSFSMDEKFEHIAKLPSGLKIIIKDTNYTFRDKRCENCPIYCQEGFYTVRVATDGTIRVCIDYWNQLPYIDGVAELQKGTLVETIGKLVKEFESVKLEENSFDKFLKICEADSKNVSNNASKTSIELVQLEGNEYGEKSTH